MGKNAGYWMERDARSVLAVKHTQEMQEKYPNEIARSIGGSIEYFAYNLLDIPTRDGSINMTDDKDYIKVLPVTTQDAILSECCRNNVHYNYRFCALNFASYTNPGGKFIDGSSAQEESLCHSSFLYNVLSAFKETYYRRNMHFKRNSFYENRGLYTPDVLFLDKNTGRSVFVDVITCAAPNKTAASNRYGYSEEANHNALRSRCKFVLDMAECNSVDMLILGAYGCGVFGQNAEEVASIFRELLETYRYRFDQVIFAVPRINPLNDNNYQAFAKVFADYMN